MSGYYCSGMKPKPDMFDSTYVASTSDWDYENWLFYLESSSSRWSDLAKRFAEEYQFAILRAIAVVGVHRINWDDLFWYILNEWGAFSDLSKAYILGDLPADWHVFAERIAMGYSYVTHLPPYYPEWLLPYGYTQRQYLEDLAVYWGDVHDDYYKLGENERIGRDSPEVARLKRLGEVARQEIDDVARHSGKYSG